MNTTDFKLNLVTDRTRNQKKFFYLTVGVAVCGGIVLTHTFDSRMTVVSFGLIVGSCGWAVLDAAGGKRQAEQGLAVPVIWEVNRLWNEPEGKQAVIQAVEKHKSPKKVAELLYATQLDNTDLFLLQTLLRVKTSQENTWVKTILTNEVYKTVWEANGSIAFWPNRNMDEVCEKIQNTIHLGKWLETQGSEAVEIYCGLAPTWEESNDALIETIKLVSLETPKLEKPESATRPATTSLLHIKTTPLRPKL